MLVEAQAAELLRRCENLVGHTLTQLRGNLRKPENRAGAIFELLALEAAAEIGSVEYEPNEGASPDIRLALSPDRKIWIEVTYLLPRYWKEEKKSDAVRAWIVSEAKKHGVDSCKIYTRFDGKKSNAGYIRVLPDIHTKNTFLKTTEVKDFFEKVVKFPDCSHCAILKDFTVSIMYNPAIKGVGLYSGGLSQEAPQTLKEHALFRKLTSKAQQHDVSGPRIICVGSDQSPVLTGNHGPCDVRMDDVINHFFARNRLISAVIIVSIENALCYFRGIKKQVSAKLFINPGTRSPLALQEIELLQRMNFGKWKYSDQLPNWSSQDGQPFPELAENIIWRYSKDMAEIEIPVNTILQALAGKTSLVQEMDGKETPILKVIKEGWVVESCFFKEGSIEQGEPSKIVFKFIPPLRVFKR